MLNGIRNLKLLTNLFLSVQVPKSLQNYKKMRKKRMLFHPDLKDPQILPRIKVCQDPPGNVYEGNKFEGVIA